VSGVAFGITITTTSVPNRKAPYSALSMQIVCVLLALTFEEEFFQVSSLGYESPMPRPVSTRTAIFELGKNATFTMVASSSAP
jgi:hypothetical protein